MNRGIGQTYDTCWFFSTLNIFLMSDNGFKVLWKKLQEAYKNFSANEKTYFNSNLNAPCPIPNRPANSIGRMYFWKFIDEYMCSIGGPGKLTGRHGRTKTLLKNWFFEANAIREARGLAPGYAARELKDIMKRMGFGADDVTYKKQTEGFYSESSSPPIVVVVYDPSNLTRRMGITSMSLEYNGYELTGANLFTKSKGQSIGHALACVMNGSKGYIFDSNYAEYGLVRCDWFNNVELRKFVTNKYGEKTEFSLDYILYIKKDYTNAISPSCRRVYKPLSANNKEAVKRIVNASRELGKPIINRNTRQTRRRYISAAIQAELMKLHGKNTPLNSNSFKGILANASSYNGALTTLKNLVRAGYTYNNNGRNYLNFKRALLAKFPRPLPSVYYTSLKRRNLTNKAAYMKELNRLSNNYTINKNSRNYKNFIETINRRFSTRARSALKRK